jgi:hypothetical protein
MHGDVWMNERVLTLIDPASDMANPNKPEPSRAMIAAMAMQGFLASSNFRSPEITAKDSVVFADALLSELAKPKP